METEELLGSAVNLHKKLAKAEDRLRCCRHVIAHVEEVSGYTQATVNLLSKGKKSAISTYLDLPESATDHFIHFTATYWEHEVKRVKRALVDELKHVAAGVILDE